MKSLFVKKEETYAKVTLSARVWIEILETFLTTRAPIVTLSARVWIEILHVCICNYINGVTLSARVWIEINNSNVYALACDGHPQCEGVD